MGKRNRIKRNNRQPETDNHQVTGSLGMQADDHNNAMDRLIKARDDAQAAARAKRLAEQRAIWDDEFRQSVLKPSSTGTGAFQATPPQPHAVSRFKTVDPKDAYYLPDVEELDDFRTLPFPEDIVMHLISAERRSNLARMQRDIEAAALVFFKLERVPPHRRPLHSFEMAANKLKQASDTYDSYYRYCYPEYASTNKSNLFVKPDPGDPIKLHISKSKPELTPVEQARQDMLQASRYFDEQVKNPTGLHSAALAFSSFRKAHQAWGKLLQSI